MYKKTIVRVFVGYMLVAFLDSSEGQFALCRNSTLNIRHIVVDITSEIVPELDENFDSFQLYAVFNWTLEANWEPPLDGFVVHFLDTETKMDYDLPDHSIIPTTPCISGEYNAWVTTSSTDVCSTNNDAVSECDDKPPNTCLCDISTCGLVNDSRCHSTDFPLTSYFQTVPSTMRSLRYPIEFNTKYEFAISPYYRQFTNLAYEIKQIEEVHDCVQILLRYTNNSFPISQALCCEQGAKTLIVHNITFTPSKPTFGSTPDLTTVEVIVTWLPPTISHQPSRYGIFIKEQTSLDGKPLPEHTDVIKVPLNNENAGRSNTTDNVTCSYVPDHMLQMVVYNLVPGVNYRIDIFPVFNDTELDKWCNSALCRAETNYTAHVIDDVCKEEYNLCDASAECILGFDPTTGRKAKCNCSSGLTGNGLHINIGQGCTEFDECHSNLTLCALEAECFDIPAPNTGFNCTCRDGYFGDGAASGSGCQSNTLYALTIALPVVIVFILVVGLVVLVLWYIKRKQRMQRRMLMEQYVPDDKGILAAYDDSDIAKNGGPWDPTFGDTWEIDKKDISFGTVIGRGNYGIVHMASLKSDWKAKTNGTIKNDGYYDPVAPSESETNVYNNADENGILVAVKSLQEGNRNHANLFNFMAEIAFMLNIGKHENIVEIYGCSTTEEPVYLVTEYLHYGDLLHFLWDAREQTKVETDPVYKVTERSLCEMVRHVANGLTYLQNIRIIHGDIAARNILVGTNGICKISDFGLANDVYRYGAIKGHKERHVPFKWISPERMMCGEVPITYKSDVWSFGNLLYETFTLGCPPHPGIQSSELLDKLKAGYRMNKPRTCNNEVFGLMDKCWKWSPASRPRFDYIVKTLDGVIEQLQSGRNETNLATTVEKLNRQSYEKEINEEIRMNDHIYSNGHGAIVGIENEDQTREM